MFLLMLLWGGPSSLIKWRFDEKIRMKLAEINWPSWDDERIKNAVPYFYEPEEFIRAYEDGLI